MGFPTFVAGRGMVDSDVLAVDRALNEYDERLYFEQNSHTGQWCAFLKTGSSEPDIPIFGWDSIPHPEDAVKRIWQADSLRHGDEILNAINRGNDEKRASYDGPVDEAAGQVAEALEWGFRKMGVHPQTRIFVPS